MRAQLESAQRVLDAVAKQFHSPVVAWSSGKDSMVLLQLARQRWPAVPVVFFRQAVLASKLAFANQIAAEWQFQMYDWPPAQIGVREGNGHLDLVSRYAVGSAHLDVSLNLYEPTNEPALCTFFDLIINRPRAQELHLPWDVILCGSKASDEDQTIGSADLRVDLAYGQPGSPAVAFPLREWTDADVWYYSEAKNVPQNIARYEQKELKANSDYYPACYRCLVEGVAEVDCPRLGIRIKSNAALVQHFPWPGVVPESQPQAQKEAA